MMDVRAEETPTRFPTHLLVMQGYYSVVHWFSPTLNVSKADVYAAHSERQVSNISCHKPFFSFN